MGDDGVKVAFVRFVLTEPVALLPPLLSLKVSVVRVEPFMLSLKVAVTTVFVPTPVAPLDGLVEVTVRVILVGGGSPPPPELDVLNDASLPVDVPAALFAAMR
jgi:hypothetical protein